MRLHTIGLIFETFTFQTWKLGPLIILSLE